MLAIVRPERWPCARRVRPLGPAGANIGRVTDDGDIAVAAGGEELARVPARALASEAVVFGARSPGARPPPHGSRPGRARGARRHPPGAGHGIRAPCCWASSGRRTWGHAPSCTSSTTTTSRRTRSPVRVVARRRIRIKGTTKAMVATTDGDARSGRSTRGSAPRCSVAEAARNVSITGATPLGVTDCLNFGDPDAPEAFWQLQEAVRGLGDACRALGLPVTGGNVSPLQRGARLRHRADA